MVIADLRRALDDDSRRPRYIETIPKRGYRLLAPVVAEEEAPAASAADPEVTPTRPRTRRFMLAALILAAVAGLAALIFSATRTPAPLVVAIAAIPNETGDRRYDPLALAVTDLVATEIGGVPGVQVVRAPGGPGRRADRRPAGAVEPPGLVVAQRGGPGDRRGALVGDGGRAGGRAAAPDRRGGRQLRRLCRGAARGAR